MKQQGVEWDLIKNHLELEGLEMVASHYPEFREEAEALAKPKRLLKKFTEIMRTSPGPIG